MIDIRPGRPVRRLLSAFLLLAVAGQLALACSSSGSDGAATGGVGADTGPTTTAPASPTSQPASASAPAAPATSGGSGAGSPVTSGPATTGATGGQAATTSPPATKAGPGADLHGVDLHGVDLAAALLTDPLLEANGELGPAPFAQDPWVRHRRVDLGGYARVSAPIWADLSGDGIDEAIVSLASGGTAGDTGVLVVAGTPAGPRVVGGDAFYGGFGYKSGFQVKDGELIIRNVAGAGWEANCCWSGNVVRRFRLVGDDLVPQGGPVEVGVAGARAMTVERFYELIEDARFADAYAFLSPARQAAEPFDSWRAGFANTLSIKTAVAPLADDAPDVVKLRLDAVDRTAGGGTTSACYQVAWAVRYSSERHQWLLDLATVTTGC